jgi:hypothetical protein
MSFGDEPDGGLMDGNPADDSGRGTLLPTTARGRDWPCVRQYNVFLANRMGALLDLVRRFETANVRIVALTIIETADCAIIRIVPHDPERAFELLTQARLPFTESDLLVVKLPENDQPLLTITKALLRGEINIHYAYPLMIGIGPLGNTALALFVDDIEAATRTLHNQGFTVFTEGDISE